MSEEKRWFVVYGNCFAKLCYGDTDLPKHIPQYRNWQVHSFDSFTQAKEFAETTLRAYIKALQREAKEIRECKKSNFLGLEHDKTKNRKAVSDNTTN